MSRHVEFIGLPGIGKSTVAELTLPAGALSREKMISLHRRHAFRRDLNLSTWTLKCIPNWPPQVLNVEAARRAAKFISLCGLISNHRRQNQNLYLDQGLLQALIAFQQFNSFPPENIVRFLHWCENQSILPHCAIWLDAPSHIAQERINQRGTRKGRADLLSGTALSVVLERGRACTTWFAEHLKIETDCIVIRLDAELKADQLAPKLKQQVARTVIIDSDN